MCERALASSDHLISNARASPSASPKALAITDASTNACRAHRCLARCDQGASGVDEEPTPIVPAAAEARAAAGGAAAGGTAAAAGGTVAAAADLGGVWAEKVSDSAAAATSDAKARSSFSSAISSSTDLRGVGTSPGEPSSTPAKRLPVERAVGVDGPTEARTGEPTVGEEDWRAGEGEVGLRWPTVERPGVEGERGGGRWGV